MSVAHLATALDRPLPQHLEAERAVLGSILTNSRAYWRVVTILGEKDFFKDSHRWIWRAIAAICEEGGAECDLLTVKHELANLRALDQAGGGTYIASLVDGIPDISNVESYAEMVKEASRKRMLITVGNAIMRAALDPVEESHEIAKTAMSAISDLSSPAQNRSRTLQDALGDVFLALEGSAKDGTSIGALRSSYDELDYHHAIRRTLVAILAPSDHGKSAFAVNLSDRLARNDHPTLFVSLESTEQEIGIRYMSMGAQIPHTRTQNWASLSDGDRQKLNELRQRPSIRKIHLARGLRGVEDLYIECRRLKTADRLDAMMVDYFQLMRMMRNRPRSREEELAGIAQELLDMAIELNICVAVLSQVTEDYKQRDSHRLHRSDTKYCKALGETARVVLAFKRPYADNKSGDAPPCSVDFQIEKNNEGRTNDVPMHFDDVTQTFAEGDCVANDCRRLRTTERTAALFNDRR